MIHNWTPALIEWLGDVDVTSLKGRYSGTTHFPEDPGSDWWTIIVEFDPAMSVKAERADARLRFMAPNGPVHRLTPGRRLDLYEGPLVVARIQIVG
jgi:hypothetical protein